VSWPNQRGGEVGVGVDVAAGGGVFVGVGVAVGVDVGPGVFVGVGVGVLVAVGVGVKVPVGVGVVVNVAVGVGVVVGVVVPVGVGVGVEPAIVNSKVQLAATPVSAAGTGLGAVGATDSSRVWYIFEETATAIPAKATVKSEIITNFCFGIK